MEDNLILLTDSYKVSHAKQYPPNTETIYSYFESRGGVFNSTIFFGLQYFLKKYLQGVVVTKEKIAEAKELFQKHFGQDLFNEEGWNYILNTYGGKLPIKIKAVPEGMKVPISNVLMTVENTDPKCFWLTNYLETLLVQVWYPTTVATLSKAMKEMILGYLKETGDESLIDFKLHDFGFRGVSSVESASIGGAAHLVNFMGTDTMASLVCARQYYKADMPGFSIPAAEHSTITSWGHENEAKAMENMLNQYPEGLVAVVSDSFNIFEACEKIWGEKLREKVLQRNGTLVVRPDSGNPVEVVCKILEILGSKFGFTTNAKGFKVLNPKIRVIQGDGCNYEMCTSILEAMKLKGWSADNLAFGMGGGLLQNLNRDTQRFAFKCSAIKKDGMWYEVFKCPITDRYKISKAGTLMLIKHITSNGEILQTINSKLGEKDILQTVFLNGDVVKEYTFDEVRKLSNNS